jgi:adenylate cyclase
MRKIFRASQPITIRFSLLRSFMLLILISSLTVLLLTTIRARRTEKELSEKLINEGTEQATQELDRFFQPVDKNTLIAARWGLAGKLNLAEVVTGPPGQITQKQLGAATRINSLLLPLMQFFPEMSSLQVANARGDGFLIIRLDGGRIRNRVVHREGWGTQTLWFDVDQQGRPHSPKWQEVDYEPRGRAWYTGLKGLPAGEVFWTDPYIFFTTRDLGITASVKWDDGGLEYVFAVDVLLKSITAFTQHASTQLSKNSQTAVYTKTWKVVGLPRHQKFRDPESIRLALLCSVEELKIPELHAALKEGESNQKVIKALKELRKAIFSFDSQGETWWAGVTAYPLGKRRHLWIGILVPNYDLLEGISQLRLYLLAATVVALLAALGYSFLLARSYSRPLEALAAQSRRIRDLDFQTDVKIEAKLQEFKQLEEAQAQALAALQSFSRYVPIEVVKELVAKGEVARIGGRTETLTILFTDIAGFTSISEAMSPEALTNHMAEYFQAMIDTLHRHGATVDKMVGDAIVAFWGAPTPIPDQAATAVHAVLETMSRLDNLNGEWRARGLPALPTRFGLATGPVVVGNIGARTRLAYTVLGDTVNLASRLEGLNKVYGTTLLVDAATRDACSPQFAWRHLDRIIVAGRTEPTDIFQVLGEAGMVPHQVLAAAARYEGAWDRYRGGDFAGAIAALDGFESEFGPDPAGQRLRERCEAYLNQPPADGWDGTSQMTSK